MSFTECYMKTDGEYEIEVSALSAGSRIEDAWMPGYVGYMEALDWEQVLRK